MCALAVPRLRSPFQERRMKMGTVRRVETWQWSDAQRFLGLGV
jgi:hypothetical protein